MSRALGTLVASVLVLLGLALMVGPWLVVAGLVSVPHATDLHAAEAATLTVAGAAALLALSTFLLATFTRQVVQDTRREAAIAQGALSTAQEQARLSEKQVDVM